MSKRLAEGEAEVFHPEYGLKGGVWYLNMPKRFVAGSLVFGDTDKCAGDVVVTLVGDGETRQATSNGFGDFEFEGLDKDKEYILRDQAPGLQGQGVHGVHADRQIPGRHSVGESLVPDLEALQIFTTGKESVVEEVLTQCTSGGAVQVHVKDGVITKIRPLVFDETDAPGWTIKARGREFTPPRKTTVMPYVVAERSRIYSDKRIKYPYKRVDFDPKGKRNPQNRGKSGYERISWDEALDIVAGEMKRIRETYGPAAITACTGSHHNWGLLFYKMGPFGRFFKMLGYTESWTIPTAGKDGTGEPSIPGDTSGGWGLG